MDAMGVEAKSEVIQNLMVVPQEAKQRFHDGMALLAGAVNIVTTVVDGAPIGFAATAVCSVTDEPPTLLVCLNRNASVYWAFGKAEKLCVNTLSGDQKSVAMLFGGKTPQAERFSVGKWGALSTGAPVLESAVVAFDCRVKDRISVGTHDVIICQVECIKRAATGSALVYFSRNYHEVE